MAGWRDYALNKDCLGGVLVSAIGIGAIAAVRDNHFGSLSRMGPGFFPTVVGAVMLLAGLAIAVGGISRGAPGSNQVARPDVRAWTLVPLSLVAFILVGEYAGLLPATFAIVVVAALADRQNTWWGTLTLAAVMVLACTVVFWWGLQVQFPLLKLGFDD